MKKVKFIKSNDPSEIIKVTSQYLHEAFTLKEIKGKDFDKKMELKLYDLCNLLSDSKKSKNTLQNELDALEILGNKFINSDLELISDRKSSLATALSDIENNNFEANFLFCLHPDCWFNHSRWNTKDELITAIKSHLRHYDTLEEWVDGGKFQPEKILDSKSWELINDLNIPLKDIITAWDKENIPDTFTDGKLDPK